MEFIRVSWFNDRHKVRAAHELRYDTMLKASQTLTNVSIFMNEQENVIKALSLLKVFVNEDPNREHAIEATRILNRIKDLPLDNNNIKRYSNRHGT
jgi:hypothetical protein